MTIAICQGCGRRASSEEIHCAACGRPLVEGDVTPPHGWMTAELGYEPVVRPEAASQPVADLSLDEAAALFVPAGARRADTEESVAPTASQLGAEPGEDDAAMAMAASLPGGHGWRVRVTAANAAHANREAAARRSSVEKPGGPGRLPRWVLTALVVAILSTSAAAAVLIVIHVMHSS